MTNVIQKALWLCRGFWGKRPRLPVTSLDGRCGQRGFGFAPLDSRQRNKQSTETKHPLIPIFTTLCSTTRPGGNTFRERRERWGGTATKVRGFHCVCVMSRDVCKRGVDLHIFSDPRAFINQFFTVPQRCSFSSEIIR